jgi:hypothetical protein
MLATTPRMVRKTSLQHSMYTPARCSATSFGLIMKQCTKPYLIWTWMDFSHHTSAFCILPHAIIAHVVEGEEQATCCPLCILAAYELVSAILQHLVFA